MSSHELQESTKPNTCRSFWTSRTTIERILIATIVICLTLLTTALALTLIVSLTGETKCSTSSCIKSSSKLNDYMDPSVDPCDNFYDFVCGNFVKRHGEQAASTPIYEQLRRTELQLDQIILNDTAVQKSLKSKTPLVKNYDEPNSLALAKHLFISCMDERKIENDKDKVIFDLVKELGGWPIILRDFWDKDKFTWLDITVKARSLGLRFDWFIDISVKRQNNKLLAEIKPPEDLKKVATHLIIYFLQLMIDTTSHFKAYWSRISLQEMSNALHFEEELLQLVESTKGIRYLTKDIGDRYNWSKIVNAVTSKNIEFYIEPRSVAYYDQLQILLTKTDKRVQANYFIWKTIYSNWPFLSRPIRSKFEEYFLLEKRRRTIRSEMCLKIVNRGLQHVVESEYVRRYVDLPLRKRIQFIIEIVKSEMMQAIEEKNWMDEHTKDTAKNRISNVVSVIGGPDRMFDSRSFDRYLGLDKFAFQSDNVVNMITQLRLHMFNTNFSTAYQNDEGWWDNTNLDWAKIDGRCHMQSNRLLLTAGMIQDEYYSENRPQYLNFGALGTAVSFALADYNMDPKNNETYFSWITDEASKEEYKKQIRCLIKHNRLSSEEMLAEYMGIDVAYRAYKSAMTVFGEDQQLTGHLYTPDQMFWIQAASFMCYKDIFSVTNNSDGKESKSFRILGPLRTSQYFANDFYCPVYSNMNPLEKCDW